MVVKRDVTPQELKLLKEKNRCLKHRDGSLYYVIYLLASSYKQLVYRSYKYINIYIYICIERETEMLSARSFCCFTNNRYLIITLLLLIPWGLKLP